MAGGSLKSSMPVYARLSLSPRSELTVRDDKLVRTLGGSRLSVTQHRDFHGGEPCYFGCSGHFALRTSVQLCLKMHNINKVNGFIDYTHDKMSLQLSSEFICHICTYDKCCRWARSGVLRGGGLLGHDPPLALG